jgi:hypothetical protein
VIIPDRDPRIDPQRGDILRGNGQVRRIMAREGDRVRCASGQYDYRAVAAVVLAVASIILAVVHIRGGH